MVEISITDNGIGIDQENRKKIFQSFFTTKEEGRGTGLGLSVSKSIVSDYGGEIEVKTKKGFGSTFKINLPLTNDGRGEKKKMRRLMEETGEMGVSRFE
jgi:signal transduction histidine kinase